MKSVLFVCTANMCRSPMAEALFKAVVRERGVSDDWWIGSAGVSASDGAPATENTQLVAAERGADLSTHLSQRATRDVVEPFSLVLVMDEGHRRALQEAMPDLAGRVHLLTEMVGQDSDIWDPVGTELENYRAMADQIDGILRGGFDRIRELGDHSTDPQGEDQARRPGPQ